MSLLRPCAHFTDEVGARGLERNVGLPSVLRQQLAGPEDWVQEERGSVQEGRLSGFWQVPGSISAVLPLCFSLPIGSVGTSQFSALVFK